MVIKKGQMRQVDVENPRGGEGIGRFTHIVDTDILKPSCTLFAKVVLEPGSQVGHHDHVEDAEIYYILSGTMEVMDNDIPVILEAGDAVYTADGDSHSIRNIGETDAAMLAVIIQ